MDIERLREHVAHFRGTLSSLAGEPPTPEQLPMHDLQTICDHVLSSDKSGPVDARELKKALRHLRMHKYFEHQTFILRQLGCEPDVPMGSLTLEPVMPSSTVGTTV